MADDANTLPIHLNKRIRLNNDKPKNDVKDLKRNDIKDDNIDDDIDDSEDYDEDDDDDDGDGDDGYSHEVINIYDEDDDDDDSDDDDDDENDDDAYNNNDDENDGQNNKARLLLFNFSPEEVVKDAQQNPTLLHTLESFASDLKHRVSLAMTNYYSRDTQQKQKQQLKSTAQQSKEDVDEDGKDTTEKMKLLKNNGCTLCHKTYTQSKILPCSCVRDMTLSSSSLLTGEQVCQDCIEKISDQETSSSSQTTILGTCWYCYHPICQDCDYINCEKQDCKALTCVSCHHKAILAASSTDASKMLMSPLSKITSKEQFQSCACGDSYYCPDCCTEHRMSTGTKPTKSPTASTKTYNIFGKKCESCEVLLECCNDVLLQSYTCITCSSVICEKCKFVFKCDLKDVVCENCVLGMEYNHADCRICKVEEEYDEEDDEIVEIEDSEEEEVSATATAMAVVQTKLSSETHGKDDTKMETKTEEEEEEDDFDDDDEDIGDY
mmetsp:Transcript_33627/g.50146  ORF Transcript_33627/g.50146 Transcript_33627/m.50146 type:complete len:493 (-) Transcript_33627:221-1699(-)